MLARTSWLTAVALCVLAGGAIDGAAQTLDWQRSRLPFPHDVTGHGVTIAHLADFPASHPDIATNETRQVWFVDPTTDHWTKDDFDRAGGEDVVHDLAIETLMAGDGTFRGVAPDANLLVVKGYQARTRANDDHAPATNDSNGLAALIRWVANQQAKYRIRVLTGSFFQYDTFLDRMDPWEASPICRAVEYANAQGIVVVWGVGNARWYSPIAPCYCPSILSVGGVTDGWENRGWSIYHHTVGTALYGRRMPDLLAPCDTPWPLPVQKKDAVRSRFQPPGSPLVGFRDDYGFGAGTSYSGPYVAAVAALCMEANPKLAPADVHRILLATADPMPAARRAVLPEGPDRKRSDA